MKNFLDQESHYNSVIFKLDQPCMPQVAGFGVPLLKLNSGIAPSTFIKLARYADNGINPREATNNRVVKEITETLETSPENFFFKSKGVVVATKRLEVLERNRLRIYFHIPSVATDLEHKQDGIMDGGHNVFAIARFIVSKLFDMPIKWKQWSDFKSFWEQNYEEIISKFNDLGGDNYESFKFIIPIEFMAPTDADGISYYNDYINPICQARNNNVQLGEPAKDNQEGCYDYLRSILPTDKYPIEWKPGSLDGNKIAVENVISMTMLPFIKLQSLGKLSAEKYGTISKVSIYSSKGQCVRTFGKILTSDEFSIKPVGSGRYELKSNMIKSALEMTEDIMKFFDILYEKFPLLYNGTGGHFGGIKGVKVVDNKKYLFKTSQKTAEYDYVYGFFYPLLCGITELMKYDEETNTIGWSINPASSDFNIEDLDIRVFTGNFQLAGFNPQVIGKGTNFYDNAEVAYQIYMLKHSHNLL